MLDVHRYRYILFVIVSVAVLLWVVLTKNIIGNSLNSEALKMFWQYAYLISEKHSAHLLYMSHSTMKWLTDKHQLSYVGTTILKILAVSGVLVTLIVHKHTYIRRISNS